MRLKRRNSDFRLPICGSSTPFARRGQSRDRVGAERDSRVTTLSKTWNIIKQLFSPSVGDVGEFVSALFGDSGQE